MKIYTVMVFEKLETTEGRWPDFGSERIMGWYSEKDKAIAAVVNNVTDIWETVYNYALVEEIDEGLYGITKNRWWFKYDKNLNRYKEMREPSEMEHFWGFSIG